MLTLLLLDLAARRGLIPSIVHPIADTMGSELEGRREQLVRLISLLTQPTDAVTEKQPRSLEVQWLTECERDLRQLIEGSTQAMRSLLGHAAAKTSERLSTLLDPLANDHDIELLGQVHETLLGDFRASQGSHFTPPKLVSELVEHSQITHDEVFHIVDPAMGTGVMLLEVARRLATSAEQRIAIARERLFGVDRDEGAVVLARLSLWLFCSVGSPAPPDVGRHLFAGDSLTGLVSLDALREAVPKIGVGQLSIEAKRTLADAWQTHITSTSVFQRDRKATKQLFEQHAMQLLEGPCAREQRASSAFHWGIELPWIFDTTARKRGFDQVVSNPPFLGGQRIGTRLGNDYRQRLVATLSQGRGGNVDLCAYFLLRSNELLTSNGALALIATNTLSQGDTREEGLGRLEKEGLVLYRAESSRSWPGSASLEISLVWASRKQPHTPVLNGRVVKRISSHLRDSQEVSITRPTRRIKSLRNQAFVGSYVLGKGFVLDDTQRSTLIDADPRSNEVILPYLDGRDITEQHPARPRRWVIQLDERNEEEAREYRAVWRHLETHVKPERLTKDAKRYPRMVETWWRHWNNRRAVYDAVRSRDRMLVRARVSSTHAFVFVPTQMIVSEQVVVFVIDDDARFGILQSSIHELWARAHASTLGVGLRYTPSDCFETFPFPEQALSIEVAERARELDAERSRVCEQMGVGPTALASLVHGKHPTTDRLREALATLDRAVVDDYGWRDISLEYDLREGRSGKRFGLSEPVAAEVLRRLEERNQALTQG
ncbi:MAG: type IIL restriction-modification enzyme MmeI [Polyangiaceae bacterium]